MAAILYVEDDSREALRVETALVRVGHTLSLASNFDQAIELCTQFRFDLVIVDLFIFDEGRLSSEGGYALIRRLRARQPRRLEWWNTVPIVAVSAGLGSRFGVDTNVESPLTQAVVHGANTSVAKSASHTALLAAVDALLPGSAEA